MEVKYDNPFLPQEWYVELYQLYGYHTVKPKYQSFEVGDGDDDEKDASIIENNLKS